MSTRNVVVMMLLVGLGGCGGSPTKDGGVDAGLREDAGQDAGLSDGGSDGGHDAGIDAGLDGGSDAGRDAGPCTSAPSDSCPGATWCDRGTCVPGCHGPESCRSGVCTSTHDCLNCQSAGECAGGRVCGTGVCSAPCTSGCDGGWLCCAGTCVDPSRDPRHCSDCGTVCAASTFCGNGACRPTVLANVCEQPVAQALLDGWPADEDAGVSMAAALAGSCTPPVSFQSSAQGDAGLLDVSSGEPLQLGQLLVSGGGSFGQRSIGWLEQALVAPVRDTTESTTVSYRRPDGGIVAQLQLSALTDTHDVFLVQLVRTPYGATVLEAAGYQTAGTVAASWYLQHVLLPMRVSLSAAWYVVDWVDTNPNGVPDASDTFTVLASGT